jgi:hypothetical protein
MIKDRFKNNVKKAKAYPEADINSNHNPVIITLKIKLKIIKQIINSKPSPTFDSTALASQPEIKNKYAIEVRKHI